MEGGDNPLRVAEDRLFFLRTQTMLGNMYANIRFAENLELRSILGTNVINQRRDYFAAAGMQYISTNGNASVINNRFNSWQFENYLTYKKEFGDIHSLNAMLGISWQHVGRFESEASADVFSDSNLNVNNLTAVENTLAIRS